MTRDIQKKRKAVRLRKRGHSVNQIAHELSLAKSTVSVWVRDVPLSKKQQTALRNRNPAFNPEVRGLWGTKAASKIYKDLREGYRQQGRELAKNRTKDKDIDFIAGIMLYWAEGHRSKNKHTVRFCNTEVAMMKFFLGFLKKYLHVKNEDVRISIYYHPNGFSINKIQNYWLRKLGLTQHNLVRAWLEDKRIVSGKRKNRFPYGVCTMSVHKTELIQKIYGAIQHYMGFTKKEWNI